MSDSSFPSAVTRVFPSIRTVSVKESHPGSIVKLSRSDGNLLALLTDDFTNGSRSFVLLNMPGQSRNDVVFFDNWQNEENALHFVEDVWFEIGLQDDRIDSRGQKSWELSGVIVSIKDQFYIRAAPVDSFYGKYRLVNIRTGAIFTDPEPQRMWSFLSWRLCVRNEDRTIALLDFSIDPRS